MKITYSTHKLVRDSGYTMNFDILMFPLTQPEYRAAHKPTPMPDVLVLKQHLRQEFSFLRKCRRTTGNWIGLNKMQYYVSHHKDIPTGLVRYFCIV